MTEKEIGNRRLHTQAVWGDRCGDPVEVVRRLAAVQAQEYAYAKWSVAQRTRDITNAAMEEALDGGSILRTHVLRPTWHFVLPEDIRWMLKLSAPRINQLNQYVVRRLGLEEETFSRANRLLGKAVAGGQHRTRPELAEVLGRNGLPSEGLAVICIVMRAELDAVLCSGASRGKQRTYAALEERAPRARVLDDDEALAELTLRYFRGHGPATLKDFLWWSSLSAAQGRAGLEMVKPQLRQETVDGHAYWFDPSATGGLFTSPAVDLVQIYDECLMSYTETRHVIQPPRPESDGRTFSHSVLLDGRRVGGWRHVLRANLAIVQAKLDRPLNRAGAKALHAAVERYGQFLQTPTTLEISA
jgi:hypothetical protein